MQQLIFNIHCEDKLLEDIISDAKRAALDEKNRIRAEKKQKLIDFLGGKCKICGYMECLAALTFHHRDPSTKKISFNTTYIDMKMEKLMEEAKKCDLLCANCHAEVHYNMRGDIVEQL